MILAIGSLVQGEKPWNKDTYLGVVIGRRACAEEANMEAFKVFWLNRPDNQFVVGKKTFCSWEIFSSIRRVDKDV